MLGIDVDAMRRALRDGSSPSLRRRRWITGLAAAGMIDFAIITLYQTGVLRKLPDPPGRLFDSNKVNASHSAYAMGHPDGTSGATLYALTTVLASFGGTRETGRHPLWDLAMAGAVGAGVAGAGKYLWDMATKQQRACPYCIVGAGLHFAMLPLALREAREGLRELNRGPGTVRP